MEAAPEYVSWRQVWKTLDPQTRREIRASVQQAVAVRDPRHAHVAVGIARRLRTIVLLAALLTLPAVHAVGIGLDVAVFGTLPADAWRFSFEDLFSWMAGVAVLGWALIISRMYGRAERANRRLLEGSKK